MFAVTSQQGNWKISRWLVALLVGALGFLSFAAQPAQAGYPFCPDNWNVYFSKKPPKIIEGGDTMTFTIAGFVTTKTYEVSLQKWGFWGPEGPPIVVGSTTGKRTETFTVGPPSTNSGGTYDINLKDEAGNQCEMEDLTIKSNNNCQVVLEQDGFADAQCIDVSSGDLSIDAVNITVDNKPANEKLVMRTGSGPDCGISTLRDIQATNGDIDAITQSIRADQVGRTCNVEFVTQKSIDSGFSVETLCSKSFKLVQACDPADRNKASSDTVFKLCQQIPESTDAFGKCARCIAGQDVNGTGIPPSPDIPEGIWTAVGCIKNNPENIVKTVVQIGIFIAGGVALLMILAASFTITTSQGDAKKTEEGREMISSAVIGIIFIIMSVTLLQFIGVSIFRIPGFGV